MKTRRLHRALLCLLTLCLVLAALPMGAAAAETPANVWGDLSWTLDDQGHLEITVTADNVIAAAMKSFQENATDAWLAHRDEIRSVTIGERVTSVSNYAFAGCSQLTQVHFCDSLQNIYQNAFKDCTALESVTIPGTASIWANAFTGCSALKTIVQETVDSAAPVIKGSAFKGCTALTHVTLSDKVTSIGTDAFADCKATLERVNIPSGMAGGSTGKDMNMAEALFTNCTRLTTVSIPAGVHVSKNAFAGCTGLTSVTFGGGNQNVGELAFSGCTGLTALTVPSGTYPSKGSFSGCAGLETVTIEEGLTTITQEVFQNCTALKTLELPASVTSVYKNAFLNCDNLEIVCYGGTEEQWNKIYILDGNDALKNARVIIQHEHTYDNGFCTVSGCEEPYQAATKNADGVYEIANGGQLYWFAQLTAQEDTAASALLTDNITINDKVLEENGTLVENTAGLRIWTPIGSKDTTYKGTFDGNGKTISGLYFQDATADGIGLIRSAEGTVKNVTLTDSYFCGEEKVGGIVAYLYGGTITGCTNQATIVAEGKSGGGIVGRNYNGTVEDCHNSGAVSGAMYIGGIAGENYNSSATPQVKNCTNSAAVTCTAATTKVTKTYVGGVVGRNVQGIVEDCSNSAVVSNGIYGRYTGGVVGYNDGGVVNHCSNSVDIKGYTEVGGILGYTSGTVADCCNTGKVSATSCAGGIAGEARAVAMSRCSNLGAVTCTGSNGQAGGLVGLVGKNTQAPTITDCYNAAAVTGEKEVGGLAGHGEYAQMRNVFNVGTVHGNGKRTGALVGWETGNGSFQNCYYLEGCATDGEQKIQSALGSGTVGTAETDGDGMTAEQEDIFASGELAYRLNQTTSEEEPIWKQTLGQDTCPNFTGSTVYATSTSCSGTPITGYTNDGENAKPDHDYRDGTCLNCGAEDPNAGIQKVEVTVGQSKTVTDLTGDYTGADLSALDTAIATVTLTGVPETYVRGEAVTELNDGNIYMIVNTRANQAMTTGSATWEDHDCLAFEEANAAVPAALWTIQQVEGGYTVRNLGGQYLTAGQNAAALGDTADVLTLAYVDENWRLSKDGYYLNDAGGKSIGAFFWQEGGYDAPTDPGSQWAIYAVSAETISSTQITFAGVKAGETSVTIGSTTYNITVLPCTEHSFTLNNPTKDCLKTAANCQSAAVYYKSCSCGANGTETFEHGEKDLNNHAGTLGTEWKHNETSHWKEYSCCGVHAEETAHSGGNATCTAQAECSTCGEKYGSLADHVYDQEVVAEKYLKTAANCQSAAVYYKSCSCGEKGTETFTNGDVDSTNHTGTLGEWKHNETSHWKEYSCCGTHAEEAAHSGGNATCTAQAECSTCGVKYGDLADHVYDQEVAAEKYLKTAANCQSAAVYYKSCSCGEKGTETFQFGEVNPENHTGTLGEWKHNETNHWKEYSCCHAKAEEAAHSGGNATCTEKAECSVCHEKYGDLADHTYDQEVATDAHKAIDATCTAKATYYKSCSCGANGTETFESGEKDLNIHTGTLGEWKHNETSHWKEYSCCHAKAEEAAHKDEDGNYVCDDCQYDLPQPETSDVIRLEGSHRHQTAIKTAEQMKEVLGVEKFDAIIVAYGYEYYDALAGSYLSAAKSAPILLSYGETDKYAYLDTDNIDYIKANLNENGTVYILGGESAVPALYETELSGYNVTRLGGDNRFETNLMILNEVGIPAGSEILVCTATNFADCLSAAATGKPILLVWNERGTLYGNQATFLNGLSNCTFTIIGGNAAVSSDFEEILSDYGTTVNRVAGDNRLATSVEVAKKYFQNADNAVLAWGNNFPDGLCGGALAYVMKSPLILTNTQFANIAADYTGENGITTGIVLGGEGQIADNAVREIFTMADDAEITRK